MGFVVKRPSRIARAIFVFKVGRGGQHVWVRFKNFSKGLSNPDPTPQKFVRGCLTSAHVDFLEITRLILMGWQPVIHPFAYI